MTQNEVFILIGMCVVLLGCSYSLQKKRRAIWKRIMMKQIFNPSSITRMCSDLEKNNVDFILFALNQCHDALRFGFKQNECNRNLKLAILQYWQNKEMGQHQTSRKDSIPKSASAKISSKKTEVDHVVPQKVIVDMLLEIPFPTRQKVRAILKKFYFVCVVTKEEHQRLTNEGLRFKMPEDWDAVDPFARYKIADIEVDRSEFDR